MVRKMGSRDLAAYRPGLEPGGITQQENFPVRGVNLKVIVGNPGRIPSALVPAVQDLQNFKASLLIEEGPGSLFSLIAGITFHGNFLKNPFFIHFYFSPQSAQRTPRKSL
jgi:hypothetical protein